MQSKPKAYNAAHTDGGYYLNTHLAASDASCKISLQLLAARCLEVPRESSVKKSFQSKRKCTIILSSVVLQKTPLNRNADNRITLLKQSNISARTESLPIDAVLRRAA